ncbi:MAG: RagB/SusD family nutrient uptake outer membrane protein [Prevotella sp.]|nr:RagB/SusD family nutrient uptake outer membrane protein [Prevotella sp.]MBQ9571206.1 RagB/SusD family nutrient uptake outer membrane protein [Prevotella sp.]
MKQHALYKVRLTVILTSVFFTVAGSFILSSCNDWLDVSPSEQKKKSEMFSKAEGFRNVLTGAYIRMKSNNLYGQEMVCGTVENLAQHWNYSSNTIGSYLNTYNYKATTVENAMTAIYNNLFKVVADVNGLLGDIDNGTLNEDDYNLIKGEALALRAFCHFDVLRLFGPMPSDPGNERILPYVKEVTNRPNQFLTYEQFTHELANDIDEAETCLKKVDPILKQSIATLNTPSQLTDNFYGYRQMRMNYYAVCAMKARLALWTGNKSQALEYARIVMNATSSDGAKMFRLGTLNDCASGDKVLSCEHIFNLKVTDISSTLGAGTTYQKTQSQLRSQLYETGTTDIRYVNMWNYVYDSYWWTYYNYFVKYVQDDNMPALARNVIPLIRLYEMYLIAMECSSVNEANTLYAEMTAARNAPSVTISTQEQLNELLIKEYNREFYGEGQAFYAYKRMAAEKIYFTNEPGSKDAYVVPLPVQESIYANE